MTARAMTYRKVKEMQLQCTHGTPIDSKVGSEGKGQCNFQYHAIVVWFSIVIITGNYVNFFCFQIGLGSDKKLQ